MNQLLNVKNDFPIFTTHPNLVYLDSAATSQKPKSVIDAVNKFFTTYNSNIHRGIYSLSQQATDIYENTRKKVADFIGADDPAEIIFTANASEALNLVAYGYARKYLQPGDIIVLTEMEHHSNFVPWLRLREEKGIELTFLPILLSSSGLTRGSTSESILDSRFWFDGAHHPELVEGRGNDKVSDNNEDYRLDYKSIINMKINKKKIKLVTLTHASNVLGTINPVKDIVDFLQQNDINAKILIDAAQSIPHIPVNVKKLKCDFLAFSSHKMLGPSGVGVLWGKRELLEMMDPLLSGGGMIRSVSKDKATWSDIPDKFEAGTGKLEGVAGLGAAIDYLQQTGMKNIAEYEKEMTTYALKMLAGLKDVDLYGSKNSKDRLGVFAFNIRGLHPHDVGEILNRKQICVRTGHHCAQPLHRALGISSSVRASLYLYNTKEDIEKLAEGIGEAKRILF